MGNGHCARLVGFHSLVGLDTIDFRFSAESPALLSVAHTVSAECVSRKWNFHFQSISTLVTVSKQFISNFITWIYYQAL